MLLVWTMQLRWTVHSPLFPMGFSRLLRFDRTPAILVCNRERNLGRVSRQLRGELGGDLFFSLLHSMYPDWEPPLSPLGSLGTLLRLRLPLQTRIAGVRSNHCQKSHGKIGDCEVYIEENIDMRIKFIISKFMLTVSLFQVQYETGKSNEGHKL